MRRFSRYTLPAIASLAPGCSAPAPADAPAPWYLATRVLDLTADGHQESWGSSYELALADSAARSARNADAFLRARLDSVLASVVVEPMDAPTVRLMAEDGAILAGTEPHPARISFSYGYETTVRLAWDAPRARFVRLWSCC